MFEWIDPKVVDFLIKLIIPNIILWVFVMTNKAIINSYEDREMAEARETIKELYQRN